jgi:hypothetical protein
MILVRCAAVQRRGGAPQGLGDWRPGHLVPPSRSGWLLRCMSDMLRRPAPGAP